MTGRDPAPAIRGGSPLDLEAVVRIERACFADPWSPGALAGELVADALRLPLVAELDGAVVGYALAWKVADQLHLLNIAVDPTVRRAGVGTALLLAAADAAASEHLLEVTLEVRRGNAAAIGFYAKHGFVEVGVREGYYADDGEDALIMDCPVASLLRSRHE